MKLEGRCFDWIRMAIFKAKDASTYYTEMRIAQEKCQRGKNPKFCELADAMQNNFEIAQNQLDSNIISFGMNCVVRKPIEYGDDKY